MTCQYQYKHLACDKPAWVREVDGTSLCCRHYHMHRRGEEWVKKMESYLPQIRKD